MKISVHGESRDCRGSYLFPASFLDSLESLVNALSCVLSGFAALSDMSEVVLVFAFHSYGLFNCFWLYLGLWHSKSRVFLLECLRILASGKQLAT